MSKLKYFFILKLVFSYLTAQVRWVELDAGYGYVIPHHEDMAYYLNEHAYRLCGTFLQKRSSALPYGSNVRKGLSFMFIHAGEKNVVGNAFALAYVLRYPLVNKAFFYLETRTGVAYSTCTYTKDNYFFNAIGTHWNALIDVALIKQFSFSKWQPFVHLSWNHYSNGTLSMPNLGINVPVLGLGLSYQFASSKPDSLVHYEKPYKPGIDVFILGGITQKKIEGPYSPVLILSFNKLLKEQKSSYWHGGGDFIYDKSIQDNLDFLHDSVLPASKNVKIGYHIGWVYAVGKLEVDLEIGSYVKNVNFSKEMIFERLTYQYFFNTRFGLRLGLRAHFAKADVIEMGIVWRKPKKS